MKNTRHARAAAIHAIRRTEACENPNETAIKADGFLVMAHGTAGEAARAKTILAAWPARRDMHAGIQPAEPLCGLAPAIG